MLPKLGREDLNPKADWYEAEERNIADIKVVHFENFTNGIVYVKLMYDLRVIPNELIPYAQLLGDILGLMVLRTIHLATWKKRLIKIPVVFKHISLLTNKIAMITSCFLNLY